MRCRGRPKKDTKVEMNRAEVGLRSPWLKTLIRFYAYKPFENYIGDLTQTEGTKSFPVETNSYILCYLLEFIHLNKSSPNFFVLLKLLKYDIILCISKIIYCLILWYVLIWHIFKMSLHNILFRPKRFLQMRLTILY